MQWSNSNYTDYYYDSRSRLNSLVKAHYGGTVYRNEAYYYNDDSTLNHSIIDTVRTDYTYDNAGELLSEVSPTYSAAEGWRVDGERCSKAVSAQEG